MTLKTKVFYLLTLTLSLTSILTVSCKKNKTLAILITTSISDITNNSAVSGGTITENNGAKIETYGICWATTENPTTTNFKTVHNSETITFSEDLTALLPNTTYHVRAYAINKAGTGYGNNISFSTVPDLNDTLFIDQRDGTSYSTQAYGSQVWMVENLKYLPSVVGSATNSETTPFNYVYGYEGTNITNAKATSNYDTYGVLYNWASAQDACPAGWHLPTAAEWSELENYLADNGYNFDGSTGGQGDKIAKAMASATSWQSNSNNGAIGNTGFPQYINKSGFSALPGGTVYTTGFNIIGERGFWWTASELSFNSATTRAMFHDFSSVLSNGGLKNAGFSVRCVRD
jgi:uncharacterized protein (TIGR02145 family)